MVVIHDVVANDVVVAVVGARVLNEVAASNVVALVEVVDLDVE